MVAHAILVDGVTLTAPPDSYANAVERAPAILSMADTDFPTRFLHDLANAGATQISSAKPADLVNGPLFQPLQRMVHVAMVQLACDFAGLPRLDPKRIVAAGIVVRRISGDAMQAWMKAPNGTTGWVTLNSATETLDPDPTKRRLPPSGQPALDALLAAQAIANASSEATSPAFAAPPATGAALGRTVVYGVVPTASSETSDGVAQTAPYDATGSTQALSALPTFLQATAHFAPVPGAQVDYRWLSDDFLLATYGPASPSTASTLPTQMTQFQAFSSTLRLLRSTFGAFDATPQGAAILASLNRHNVYSNSVPTPLGDFYANASATLLDYDPTTGGTPPTITMPDSWDALDGDDTRLFTTSLATKAAAMVVPQGRFQNSAWRYRLRMFFRITSEHPGCPPLLVWSKYSDPFRIAAWYESSDRPSVPIPLPDPTDRNVLAGLKPNCAFAMPAGLMNAMAGASMSGLMNGGGSGGGPNVAWICSFSIPIITICASFVLNIFLGLLNIVFCWMPFVKICIPVPEE